MTNIRDYQPVIARTAALCEGEEDIISLMATISAELFHSFDGFDWVGFYRVTSPQILKIGPYQGGHGCLVIPFDKGVCGAAARTKTTQLIDDVHSFEGHIACSSSTLSELVIPVLDGNENLLGVLDIDSDRPAFFNSHDVEHLTKLLAHCFGK